MKTVLAFALVFGVAGVLFAGEPSEPGAKINCRPDLVVNALPPSDYKLLALRITVSKHGRLRRVEVIARAETFPIDSSVSLPKHERHARDHWEKGILRQVRHWDFTAAQDESGRAVKGTLVRVFPV